VARTVVWLLIALLGPHELLLLGLLPAAVFEGHAPLLANLDAQLSSRSSRHSGSWPTTSSRSASARRSDGEGSRCHACRRGSLLVVALFHAGVDVAFSSSASSPVVINTAGALITLWGIAVMLMAGPRRLASRTSHKEYAS